MFVCASTCVFIYVSVRVRVRVLGEERPIKKLPEERAFSWESVGGQRGWQGHCVSQLHPER